MSVSPGFSSGASSKESAPVSPKVHKKKKTVESPKEGGKISPEPDRASETRSKGIETQPEDQASDVSKDRDHLAEPSNVPRGVLTGTSGVSPGPHSVLKSKPRAARRPRHIPIVLTDSLTGGRAPDKVYPPAAIDWGEPSTVAKHSNPASPDLLTESSGSVAVRESEDSQLTESTTAESSGAVCSPNRNPAVSTNCKEKKASITLPEHENLDQASVEAKASPVKRHTHRSDKAEVHEAFHSPSESPTSREADSISEVKPKSLHPGDEVDIRQSHLTSTFLGKNAPLSLEHSNRPDWNVCSRSGDEVMSLSMSAASSRTNTLDSATSAPSPSQLYPRKASSAQLSINSSQSSLGGRDGYASASEQESLHSVNSTPHLGRHSGVSPSMQQPANPTSHLSGLVCNVHRTTGKEPHALVGATTTILGDCLYVFGGRKITRPRPSLTSDVYELDLNRRHWTKIDAKGDIPPPRYFHSVCALGDNKLICYGGMAPELSPGQTYADADMDHVSVMSDIHIFDVPTRTWTKIHTTSSPQARYAHCAAVLPSSAVFASASAPLAALHNNASGANPNQGSIGVKIDGTGGTQMIVVGGQDSGNHYIESISVFNLRSMEWTSTEEMVGRSCGAYRSVVCPLTTLSAGRVGAGPHRADEDDDSDDEDEADDLEADASGAPMIIYTNYNFLDVKLELQVRLPDGTLSDKQMQTNVSPPGLRFPSGGIIDNHFVVSGTFLTSSKQEFSLWALDLRTLTWARIDTGSNVFSQGSWNRGVLWNRRNTFVIMGNRSRSLVEDYNNRRLNFSHMCLVQLEAFGLYDNPRRSAPSSDYVSVGAPLLPLNRDFENAIGGRQLSPAAEALGELALSSRELTDMDILAIDGTRIPVNSRLIANRWGSSFNALLREAAVSSDGGDTATLRGATHVPPSRNSSITITPSVSSMATTLTANTGNTSSTGVMPTDPADARSLAPTSRPRLMYLPHAPQTIDALLHYLYTSSLPPPGDPLATTQIFTSLMQIAIPYRIDGLPEAVIERLHGMLDGRNAAAIFNAAAMAAGGGRDIAFSNDSGSSVHPPRTASLAGFEALSLSSPPASSAGGELRIDTDVANGMANGSRPVTRNTVRGLSDTPYSTDDEDEPDSASTMHSAGSQLSASSAAPRVRRGHRQVWSGDHSSTIGLQKRGLRGLMEGRQRARERGRSEVGTLPPSGEGSRVGLGLALS